MSLASMLEWKYGPVAGTKQADEFDVSLNPNMVISYWKHLTILKPTSTQLKLDFKEYADYLQQVVDREQRREYITEQLELEKDKGDSLNPVEVIKLERALETGSY